MTRTAAETRRVVEDYVRAFNARDLDSVMSLYAEDATLEDPVGSEVHRGRPAIRSFYDGYLNQPSFLQLTGDFRFAGNAVAFSFFCYLGTGANPMIVQITDSFRFDEQGRIREMRAFWGDTNVHGIDDRSSDDGGQLPLAGRVALVRGVDPLRERCARLLSSKGATLVLTGDGSDGLAEKIVQSGGRAVYRDAGVVNEFGRLDLCIDILTDVAIPGSPTMAGAGVGSTVWIVDEKAPVDVGPMSDTESGVRLNCLRVRAESDPQAVAEAAIWLVSPTSRAVRGQTIDLC